MNSAREICKLAGTLILHCITVSQGFVALLKFRAPAPVTNLFSVRTGTRKLFIFLFAPAPAPRSEIF